MSSNEPFGKLQDDRLLPLIRLALEMLEYVGQYPGADRPLQFRIGINSGPAVAGVIGQRKFEYDLWGDTVNVASRMESHGRPGEIQISRRAYELLSEGFVCQPRGRIDVKVKGQMETWFLKGTTS